MQDLINDALQHRAELVESRIDLNSRDINTKAVRNALLPTLDAFAYYGGSGVGRQVIALLPPLFPQRPALLLHDRAAAICQCELGGVRRHSESSWSTRPRPTKAWGWRSPSRFATA